MFKLKELDMWHQQDHRERFPEIDGDTCSRCWLIAEIKRNRDSFARVKEILERHNPEHLMTGRDMAALAEINKSLKGAQ